MALMVATIGCRVPWQKAGKLLDETCESLPLRLYLFCYFAASKRSFKRHQKSVLTSLKVAWREENNDTDGRPSSQVWAGARRPLVVMLTGKTGLFLQMISVPDDPEAGSVPNLEPRLKVSRSPSYLRSTGHGRGMFRTDELLGPILFKSNFLTTRG